MNDADLAMTTRPPVPVGEGRYLVYGNLGTGGAAGVYVAWDNVGSQWVAVKALSTSVLNDAAMRSRFEREAETMKRLRNPHITRLFDARLDHVPPFIVMELARGGSAMDWVRRHGPMPAALAVDLAIAICAGLAAAHGAGVVHRDVKPHNFLIHEDGTCRITDFGIARTDEQGLTLTGVQIGTFSYMAPEQRSNTKNVDNRADVYGVGASLFTLLTGTASSELFVADQDDTLLEAVPEALKRVILTATQYNPEDRYEGVTQLSQALRRVRSTITEPPRSVGLARGLLDLPATPPETVFPSADLDDLDRSLLGAPDNSGVRNIRKVGETAPRPADRTSEPGRRRAKRPVRSPGPQLSPGSMYALMGAIAVTTMCSVGAIAFGSWVVGQARSEAEDARDQMLEIIETQGLYVAQVGHDGRLERMYFDFKDAAGPERTVRGLSMVDALEDFAGARRLPADLQPRMAEITEARTQYATSMDRWALASNTRLGTLAVALGTVPRPDAR